jgi:hypothetical protein
MGNRFAILDFTDLHLWLQELFLDFPLEIGPSIEVLLRFGDSSRGLTVLILQKLATANSELLLLLGRSSSRQLREMISIV